MTTGPWSPETVARAGFCIGCGLCQARLGEAAIRLVENERGLNEPVENRPLTEGEIADFGTYCPGARMSAPPQATDVPYDPMWGNMRLSRRVYAADPETRFRSASGGALTALCRQLLASGEVAFVQHVRPDPDRALHSVAWRSETFEDLAVGSSSRYAPTSPLAAFEDALADGRPFAYVGRPCDVMAVRQLQRIDERAWDRCRYLLAFVCGGASDLQVTTRYLHARGTDETRLESMSWRGQGCPGPVVARERNGVEHRASFFTLYGGDESTWGLFLRCKLCADAIGLNADVVAADCWKDGEPLPDENGVPIENDGFNYIIARTEKGERLVRDAQSEGHLVVESTDMTPADFNNTQPHHERWRRALKARYEGIAEVAPIPVLEPGLDLAAMSLPAGEEYDAQKVGSARRYKER